MIYNLTVFLVLRKTSTVHYVAIHTQSIIACDSNLDEMINQSTHTL